MAVIQLHCKAMTGAWLTSFCTARYTIDSGPEVRCAWGENTVYAPPGRHHLRVWYNYLGPTNTGQTVLDTTEERPTRVVYTTRWNIFLKGKMEVDGQMVDPAGTPIGPGESRLPPVGGAPAAMPPAWHPDPTQRHELRWWDGQAWTPSVSDAGTVSIDPL